MRRRYWEYFYLMGHFQLIFPMLWGMFFNDRVSIFPYYVVAFAVWGWSDLPLRIFMKAYQPTRVLSASAHGNVARLRLTKKSADGSGKAIGLMTSKWEAGSYVWLAVRMPNANPLKGKAPPPFNADWACYHPMTISSPPVDRDGKPASDFTVHVKSMGHGTWSQALVDKIGQMGRDNVAADVLKVWVGGPNGQLAISPMDCDRVVLIAGGIGVTPMIAIAQDLAIRGRLGGEHAKGVPEVEFVYTERHLENFNAFEDELTFLTTKSSSADAPSLTFKPYCTQPGTKIEADGLAVVGTEVVSGRPKFAELLASAAQRKGSLKMSDGERLVVGVFSCGPPKMMADVRVAVQGASTPSVKFYLHEETFEL